MKPLSKGDPCRVRLHTGEVVEAVYDCPDRFADKAHWVEFGGWNLALVWGLKPAQGGNNSWQTARFVGPSCVLVPVGVSV